MTTDEIIAVFENFVPFGDHDSNYDNESYFYDVTDHLEQNPDGKRAIKTIFMMLEKYPNVDFGSPGPLVHTLERYRGFYEKELYESIQRKPTPLTIWMLNRIINATKDGLEQTKLLKLMSDALLNNRADAKTQKLIQEFIDYQKKSC